MFGIVAGTPRETLAQGESKVILKAEAGFDGYVEEGKWMPVRITVENNGPDVEGIVQVKSTDYSKTSSAYGVGISLPTNSRKEFFIYARHPQGRFTNLDVEFVSDEKIIVKTSLRVITNDPQIIFTGIFSSAPSKFNILNQVTSQNGITRVVRLYPSSMPDLAEGLEILDIIIFDDEDTGALTPAQQKAIELWIAKGGALYVIGGPKWQASSQGIKSLLPMQISGNVTTTAAADFGSYDVNTNEGSFQDEPLPADVETILATGKLTQDAQILATQGEYPLLIQRQLGRGKITFFAADPGLAPYKNWEGMLTVYENLFLFRPSQAAWFDGQWDTYSTNEALTTIAELDIPSIFFICGWLTFYILLIGPANYLVLRIIKKREWAWVTIPAIVILVSAVSYIYGFLYRGNNPTLNRLTVVQAWDGVSQAESHSLIGIYSPQRDKYTLEAAENFLLYPYTSSDMNLQGNTSWASVLNGQNITAPDIPIEIGGMKVISAQGVASPLPIEHDLTFHLSQGNSILMGTIVNNSDVILHDAVLVTPADWKTIGDLSPGKSIKTNLNVFDLGAGPTFYNAGAMSILNLNYPIAAEDEAARRKEAFLRSVLTTEFDESNGNWGIYLMGWLEEPVSSANLQDFKSNVTDTTFYIQRISPAVSVPDSEIKLTTSLFEWESSNPSVSPYYGYESSTGEFTLHFRPAIDIKFDQVTSLELSLDSYSSPSAINVSLWDHTLNDWVVVDNVRWGGMIIPEPERYVSGNGEIFLKIKDPANNYIEMKRSGIELVVQP
jgi:hypothetical protein